MKIVPTIYKCLQIILVSLLHFEVGIRTPTVWGRANLSFRSSFFKSRHKLTKNIVSLMEMGLLIYIIDRISHSSLLSTNPTILQSAGAPPNQAPGEKDQVI